MPSVRIASTTIQRRSGAVPVSAALVLAFISGSLQAQTVTDPRPNPVTRTSPSAAASQPKTPQPTAPRGAASPTTTRGVDTNPQQSGGSSLGPEIVGGALVALATYLIIKAVQSRSNHGPEVKNQLDMNDFTIEGLAGANWPVGFDFQASAPGSIQIDITTDGGHSFTQTTTVTPGRRDSLRFRLPSDFNAKVQDAKFHISFLPNAGSPPGTPALQAFGLAAGVNAVEANNLARITARPPGQALYSRNPQTATLVRAAWAPAPTPASARVEQGTAGSIALDDFVFGPSAIHPKLNETANYGFHARHAFNDVRPDFVLTTFLNGHILLQKDREEQPFPIGEGEFARKTWDATKSKPGDHRLQVKAWRGLEAGGDWAVAWSPDVVNVER